MASAQKPEAKPPIIIKKYANRRLYNTETSVYVTLEDLAEMVKREEDFHVVDAKSNEDLTHSVLTQIILEQEGRGQTLLPVSFLRQLIRFYGDSLGSIVPSYLEMSIGMLTSEQDKLRQQMEEAVAANPFAKAAFAATPFGAGPFGVAAVEAMQEQAKQNVAIFQNAMQMFSPFGQFPGAPPAPNGEAKPASPPPQAEPAKPAAAGKPSAAAKQAAKAEANAAKELSELQARMAEMQNQLERLARNRP